MWYLFPAHSFTDKLTVAAPSPLPMQARFGELYLELSNGGKPIFTHLHFCGALHKLMHLHPYDISLPTYTGMWFFSQFGIRSSSLQYAIANTQTQ